MRKKGQAAMEFLMTYGWAILAAIIVVGVLWYLIGNPANLAGSKYTLSAPLVANAFSFTANGSSVSIEIRNGAGTSIGITNVSLIGCGSNSTGFTWTDGSLNVVSIACSPHIGSSNRLNGDLTVYYTKSGSSIIQQATGTISGRVP